MFANVFNSLKKFLLWCASPRRLKVHQLSAVLLSLTVCVPAPMHKSAKSSCVNDKRIKLTGDWGIFNSHRKGLDPMLAPPLFLSFVCFAINKMSSRAWLTEWWLGTPLAPRWCSRCIPPLTAQLQNVFSSWLLFSWMSSFCIFVQETTSGRAFRCPPGRCKPFPAKSLNEENSIWIAHKG